MSTQRKTGKPKETESELPGGGNIDNIREILFGTHMRQYEKRFQRLEDLLTRETTALRDELRRRLDALEAYVKQEAEALAGSIKNEGEERKVACAELGKQTATLGKEHADRIGRAEEASSTGLRELRTKLLSQSKTLSDEIREKSDGLLAELSHQIDELRNEKTDRAALMSLFTEMALRLGDQLHLPSGDSE